MKLSFNRLLLSTLFAAAFTSAVAQNPPAKPAPPAPPTAPALKAPPSDTAKPAKPAHARHPFHGTVKSCDAKAMTVTLEGKEHDRVLHLNGDSRLSKEGKDTTLTGIAAGDYLHGTATKNSREEEVIVRAQAGPKPASKAKDEAGDKEDGKKAGKEKKHKKDK